LFAILFPGGEGDSYWDVVDELFPLYNLAMKISTKTGDKGSSGLYTGRRVRKSELIFEVLGDIDELNAVLGLCKVEFKRMVDDIYVDLMETIQDDVYRVMAVIGNDMSVPRGIREIDRKETLYIEQHIEKLEQELGDIKQFIAPGENEISARLHLARCVCRRAERSIVAYNDDEQEVPEYILQYMNRLSDLLFLLAEKF